MKILLGKAYITGRRSPRKRCVLKKRKEGVRMPVSVADANVCSTLHMHLGHPTLANRPGHDVFLGAGKSAQTCRPPKGICIRRSREYRILHQERDTNLAMGF